jgi:hypothetical protein
MKMYSVIQRAKKEHPIKMFLAQLFTVGVKVYCQINIKRKPEYQKAIQDEVIKMKSEGYSYIQCQTKWDLEMRKARLYLVGSEKIIQKVYGYQTKRKRSLILPRKKFSLPATIRRLQPHRVR